MEQANLNYGARIQIQLTIKITKCKLTLLNSSYVRKNGSSKSPGRLLRRRITVAENTLNNGISNYTNVSKWNLVDSKIHFIQVRTFNFEHVVANANSNLKMKKFQSWFPRKARLGTNPPVSTLSVVILHQLTTAM